MVNQTRYRARNRSLLAEYLIGKSCVDCGLSEPVVLEFDHVRGDKEWDLSDMVYAGMAWSRISAELDKCDIRCANCHRRKTARDFKWFRGNFGA
jgi:hypothetical protein